VAGERITKPGHVLRGGEPIEVQLPPPVASDHAPDPIPLDVIFESEEVLVVNKPAGMVVHPSPGHVRGTLVHAALARAPDLRGVGGELRPGVVHRLDKDTSGLILLAKSDAAHRSLQQAFRARAVEKTYLGLVDGAPPTARGRVAAPIGRDLRHRERMAIVAEGKGRQAETVFRTRERFPHHSLLEFQPITGRTHQVRVHAAFLGCPIIGDRLYGRRAPSLPVARQLLHAWRLKLILPGERSQRLLEAALPEDFEQALRSLRASPGS
jgi:23S rRNA pseudouridine1911/1915/1917 synthase